MIYGLAVVLAVNPVESQDINQDVELSVQEVDPPQIETIGTTYERSPFHTVERGYRSMACCSSEVTTFICRA